MTRTRTIWKARDHAITIGQRTLIMGVLNVTPDSFSDGGKYLDPDAAAAHAMEMEAQGADIIDIGAESTKPGSQRISAGEELRRLIPVLKRLKNQLSIPISVDTYKAEVAAKALEHGASIINDVSALTWEPDIVKPVAQYDAGLILNHMRGTPESWGRLGPIKDVMGVLLAELEAAVHRATRGGILRERIVIDPGIGFGKRGEQNSEILARIGELQRLMLPVLVAASRKSFLAQDNPRLLEFATAAAVTTAILHGAAIVRVHDVVAMKPVVATADAIIEAIPEREEKPKIVKSRAQEFEDAKRRPIRPPQEQRAAPAAPTVAPKFEEPRPAAPRKQQEEFPRRPFERRAPDKREERTAYQRRDEDRPPKPFKDREPKPFKDRDARPFKDRAAKPFSDREPRPFKDRDAKPFKKTGRPFRPKDGEGGDRRRRPFQKANNGRTEQGKPFEKRGKPFAPRGDRRGPPDRERGPKGPGRPGNSGGPRKNRPSGPGRSGPPRGGPKKRS